jgi:hypothetical protein
MGDMRGAYQEFARAVNLLPEFPRGRYTLAIMLSIAGRTQPRLSPRAGKDGGPPLRASGNPALSSEPTRVPLFLILALLAVAGCSRAVDPLVIADAQTAARVKTVLVNDPEVGGRAIEVHVAASVVTLSGRVQSAQEADRVVELTRSVAGVAGVQSNLRIGIESPPRAEGEDQISLPADDLSELQPNPTLLAAGGSFGWSTPRAPTLQTRASVSPLVRLGSGRGLGPALGFDWFHADVRSSGAQGAILSRVHVKPVMLGVGYTLTAERLSVAPSLVAGPSFNSLTITDIGVAAGVPVEVDNSLAWRPGVSVWFEMGRRLAVNVSGGYLMTRLRITALEGGRLVKRDERGDTALVRAGLAYKLF